MGEATAAKGRESMPVLLSIEDLAARWGTTPAKAWAIVREGKVPFLSLGSRKPDLNGKGPRPVKFRAEAVDRWEREREGTWEDPKVEPAPPRPVPAPRPSTASERLGLRLPPRTGR